VCVELLQRLHGEGAAADQRVAQAGAAGAGREARRALNGRHTRQAILDVFLVGAPLPLDEGRRANLDDGRQLRQPVSAQGTHDKHPAAAEAAGELFGHGHPTVAGKHLSQDGLAACRQRQAVRVVERGSHTICRHGALPWPSLGEAAVTALRRAAPADDVARP
jgi:hypothetical protein